jgi:hypothetical protein
VPARAPGIPAAEIAVEAAHVGSQPEEKIQISGSQNKKTESSAKETRMSMGRHRG